MRDGIQAKREHKAHEQRSGPASQRPDLVEKGHGHHRNLREQATKVRRFCKAASGDAGSARVPFASRGAAQWAIIAATFHAPPPPTFCEFRLVNEQ